MGLQLAVSLPVLVAAVWAVRRTADPLTRVAVLVGATPLLTPYAFNYDLTAVAAVLVWRLVGAWPSRTRWELVYGLAWLAPTAMMLLNLLGLGIAPLANIAFFAMVVAGVWQQASQRPAPAIAATA
jgi:hypothetical protein